MSGVRPIKPAQEGSVTDMLGCLAVLLGVPLLACCGVGLLVWKPGVGEVVGRFPVVAEPHGVQFSVAEPAVLQVWADIDLRHEGFNTNTSASDLPHVIDYVVEVERDGQSIKVLRCNPFYSNVFLFSGKHSSMGEASGRSYEGLLKRCSLPVEPGEYRVQVHSADVRPDKRIWFTKMGVVLRVR